MSDLPLESVDFQAVISTLSATPLDVEALPAGWRALLCAVCPAPQGGSHLWLAALTSAAPGGVFAANAVYNYWLSATEPNWPALAFAGSLQAFPGLPEHLEDLVVLPVSCRKWAGSGSDALALAPQIIESGWLAASLTRARTC